MRTTDGSNAPPADPATIAKAVNIPSRPPNIIGLRKPPSFWCCSSLSPRLSWKSLERILKKMRIDCRLLCE